MAKWLAILMAMAGQSGGDAAPRPVALDVTAVGAGIRVAVVAAPAEAFSGRFTLEVDSDVDGGGNRSRHAGSARLAAGEQAVLSVVTLGHVTPGQWSARLIVEPDSGSAYHEERRSL